MEGRPLFFPILLRADAGVTLTGALADVLSHTFPRQLRNLYVRLLCSEITGTGVYDVLSHTFPRQRRNLYVRLLCSEITGTGVYDVLSHTFPRQQRNLYVRLLFSQITGTGVGKRLPLAPSIINRLSLDYP